MAEKYIVNMPLKTTPDDTDLMVIEDAQDTKRITWANVVKPINDAKANKSQEDFIDATLLNGWTGYIQYAKNDLGIVTVTMQCTSGTVAGLTNIATLPVGYRPKVRTIFAIFRPTHGDSSDGDLYIHTDGRIRIMDDSNLASDYLYGSQISFYAG